ncbi:molybdopterin-dependent oxidoreductase [Roseiarcaceae bacterium H3SJ34-1]|uniref:molybdopterin cofactor-binding domain-containing protein n=1 Tax=Terripilifer ovatus TaxID=3032367 RepID=UPI003AB91FEB|nr:molybdopterin-dependent oxidoreductase [Roseiarcaceae bacterium H3SJ34-1]
MTGTLGRHVRPIDWQQRTSGAARYTADLFIAESLTVRVVRSPHAYAAVRSIDTAKAATMPGVHAIITIADFPPGARYIHEGARDRPPLAEGMVRYVGQEIAAVAAETAEQAAAAADAVVVSYDRKRGPLTIAAAQGAWSAALHKRTNGKNISKSLHRSWGEPLQGSSDGVSVDGRFVFSRQTHASMEPNSIIAQWDAEQGCLHLWVSTQAPIFVRDEVAQILGLAKEQVVCHEVFVGGGFGSKSRISEHEVIAAALALKVKRPVRLVLDRNEEFETTKSRHAFHMELALHADASGHMRAITGRFQVDNGAYDHSGMSVTSAGMKGLGLIYRPRSIRLDAQLIDTATLPGGQFRGYGTTQVTFALESLMDELAGRLERDPIDLRLQNANRDGEETLIGARPRTVRLADCLIAARDAIGWDKLRNTRPAGHGVGIASGVHLSGSYAERDDANRSDAAIDMLTNGKVRLRFGGADTGTGQRTMLAQIVAGELGLALDDVDVMTMDTALTPFDLGAWSSRGTHYSGHAARLVAKTATKKLESLAQGRVLPIGDLVALSNEAVDGMLTVEASFVETAVQRPDPKTGLGNVSASYNFAAHAAHVKVDTRTGKVELIDYVAVHDVGTPLNPAAVHGQIVGGAAMGIGAALGEDLVFEQGKLVTTGYTYYALPRAADIPSIRSFIVNCADPLGPYGAKGVGELGINPPPPAIANAVADAIGVRIRELPITPDKIVTALARKEGRNRHFNIWRRPDRWWIAFVRWAYPLGLFRLLHAWRTHQPSRSVPPEIEELAAPASLDEALSSLDRGAVPMGGGTDLLLRRSQMLSTATRLVSLAGIADLSQIAIAEDGAVTIGSAVSLSRLCAPSATHPAVAAAAQSIASHQIRNMATIAGNLLQANRCWFYRNGFECYQRVGAKAPCYAILGDHRFYHAAIDGHRCQAVTPSDMATALTALDATIHIRGRHGTRTLPIRALYTGPGQTVLQDGEVIAAITLPAAARTRVGAFRKLNLWHGDFAIGSVAITCRIDEAGCWHDPRIVCGALAPVPWRAVETEKALAGRKVTAALLRAALDEELNAKAHPLARNAWKLDALAGLCEQAVEEINEKVGR